MQISDILSPSCITSSTDCHSKKDALDMLAKMIAVSDNTTSQTEIFNCLITRERLGSTGLGKGIAIPHGRLKQGGKTFAAFLRLEKAVDYDAIDKQPVDLFFALIVPEESTEEHLETLAKLAKMFSDQDILSKLRTVNTTEKIYSILTG